MSPKQPTNSDIYRKLDNMDVRLTSLESWKIAEDAAKKAVGEYKLGEVDMSRRKLYTDIGKFVAVLALLAWIIIQYLSTVKK